MTESCREYCFGSDTQCMVKTMKDGSAHKFLTGTPKANTHLQTRLEKHICILESVFKLFRMASRG